LIANNQRMIHQSYIYYVSIFDFVIGKGLITNHNSTDHQSQH